jgi:hypothetical protein
VIVCILLEAKKVGHNHLTSLPGRAAAFVKASFPCFPTLLRFLTEQKDWTNSGLNRGLLPYLSCSMRRELSTTDISARLCVLLCPFRPWPIYQAAFVCCCDTSCCMCWLMKECAACGDRLPAECRLMPNRFALKLSRLMSWQLGWFLTSLSPCRAQILANESFSGPGQGTFPLAMHEGRKSKPCGC